MADKHAEALCRLMDGELGETEARFLIRRLSQDRELTARWGRYHLARSVVREHARLNLNGFSARVAAALDGDPAPARSSSAAWLAWLKPVGGAALAASVALLVFNAWRQPAVDPAGPQLGTQTLLANADAERLGRPLMQATLASSPMGSGAMNPRLRKYLIRHNEATGPGRNTALVPYWSLASVPPPQAAIAEPPEAPQEPVED